MDITIGLSEEINNWCYTINEITLTAKLNDVAVDNTNNAKLVN